MVLGVEESLARLFGGASRVWDAGMGWLMIDAGLGSCLMRD